MNPARTVIAGSLAAAAALILLLWWPSRPKSDRAAAGHSDPSTPLVVYCAAGMKGPVEVVAREYEAEFGVPVHLQYGGSGTLLANLRIARTGDLYLAADGSYLDLARSNGLVAEILPLARLTPVLAVRTNAPVPIGSLTDLLQPGVTLALANPEAAAVGRLTRDLLQAAGRWDALAPQVRVFKPTVNEVANDVKLGTVTAGVVWDATAAQYPELRAVPLPELAAGASDVAIAVLQSSTRPAAALRFARYLAARDRGLRRFAAAGFQVVRGDLWAATPEVVLYSGGVNRVAIEESLREFEAREGARVTRVYNGCGILTAQIRAGQRPDAYFACDVSFMTTVGEHFGPALDLAETRIVILTRKDNPAGLTGLADLTRPGLALGVANAQQSALGALTARLLESRGLLERVMANVRVQAPTADLLVNQLRAGGLDAVVVYRANTSQVRDVLTVVELPEPEALAIQPYAIGRNSDHVHLMERLLAKLRSDGSRSRFEESGFTWKADPATP